MKNRWVGFDSWPFWAQLTAVMAGAVLSLVLGKVITGNLAATATAPTQKAKIHMAKLSWNATSSNNVTYKIYKGPSPAIGPGKSTPWANGIRGTTYEDSYVKAGETYWYAVTAVDSNNKESSVAGPILAKIPGP